MDQPVPPTPRYQSVLVYLLALAVTVGLLYYGMRLEYADYKAPFSYDRDALLILPLVKSTIEQGGHWRNDRLGAPGVQELHDFPIVDHLHLWLIALIGVFVRDPVLAFNLYYLATYPLTTLSGMFVLRRFGLSLPAAATGGILYAFQPYHYLREEVHYFLSAYYLVPFALLLALKICQGKLPFFPRNAEGLHRFRFKDRAGWFAFAIGVATACAGAYYAFFSCAFLMASGAFGWYSEKSWRALASAIVLAGVIAVAGIANHYPAFVHHSKYGYSNRATVRFSEEAETYGLKVAQLVLPAPGHNWLPLSRMRSEYDDRVNRHCQTENEWGAIGAVASAGFIGLLAVCFFPVRKAWPIGALSALTLFGVLYGTIGGLGAIFNHVLFSQIRAPNRISIFLAFLALFAAVWAVDRLFAFFAAKRDLARHLLWPAFLALGGFGLWDELNCSWFDEKGFAKTREEVREKYWKDREYFQNIERALETSAPLIPPEFRDGKAPAVFNLPYVHFPEAQPVNEAVKSYDHIRGYLHTTDLRWSFGAVVGREWDMKFRTLADEPADRLVDRLVAMGFRGLLVDTRGYPMKALGDFDRELLRALGSDVPRVVRDGEFIFYDLTLFASYIMRNFPARYAEMRRIEMESITPLWLRGFVSYDSGNVREFHRVDCMAKGNMVLLNPSDRERRVRIDMELSVPIKDPCKLTIKSATWNEDIDDITDVPKKHSVVVDVPPGHNRIVLLCPVPSDFLFTDDRKTFLMLNRIKVTEVHKP